MSLPLLTETRRALGKLEHAAQEITRAAGRPVLYGESERQWYRFPDTDILQVIAVKAARVVSGLNACVRLLHEGHTVEVAVLLRTVDDFVDETTFLLEAFQSQEPTRAQRDFVDHFFNEETPSPQEMLRDRRGPHRAKRRDIRAAQGRYLLPENPDRFRRLAMAIDGTWDGYVHGAYPHSMELYDPNHKGGAFRMDGTNGTPYPVSYQRQVAYYVSRALNVFADVVMRIGRQPLAEELIAQRQRYEESSEYPGGDED